VEKPLSYRSYDDVHSAPSYRIVPRRAYDSRERIALLNEECRATPKTNEELCKMFDDILSMDNREFWTPSLQSCSSGSRSSPRGPQTPPNPPANACPLLAVNDTIIEPPAECSIPPRPPKFRRAITSNIPKFGLGLTVPKTRTVDLPFVLHPITILRSPSDSH
jgi:hypothetical protein